MVGTYRDKLVRAIAAWTRMCHPRGTERLIRILHNPDNRPWAVDAIVKLPRHDLLMHVSTSSFLEWCVFFYGEYEAEVASVLRTYCSRARVAVDVGANVGIHTLVMAKYCTHGTVLAYEPVPELFSRLLQNLTLNRLNNVRAEQLAVAARSGVADLFLPPQSAPNNRGRASMAPASDWRKLRVQSVTLDDVASHHHGERVDLIKIDVEGFEGAVLAGAYKVLRTDQPALVFEYSKPRWSDAGYTWETVINYLEEAGYRRFLMITPKGPIIIRDQIPEFMNVLALPSKEQIIS